MEWRVGDDEGAGWSGVVTDREVDKWDPLICWEEIFCIRVRDDWW